MTPSIIMGATYRDRITDFTGIATGLCQYISGCSQALIQPFGLTDKGDVREARWIDEQRLEQQAAAIVVLENGATPGADAPAPIR